MEKNEMGGVCNTYGERKGAYLVLVGKPKGKRPLVTQGIDGRIILRWIFRKWDGWSMEWFHLARDRERWRALVNAVMNLLIT
jgi:hypothetical protein